jgi:arylsulfatase A-like enzyme
MRIPSILKTAALGVVAAVLVWALALRHETRAAPSPGGTIYDADGYAVRDVKRPDSPPNLVLVVIDTLRADSLSTPEGGVDSPDGKPLMPFLSSLAADGVSFADVSASSSWTLPSITSLLTGLAPSVHGATDARNPPALASAVTTFAEVLAHTYGYETVAFYNTTWLRSGDTLQGFDKATYGFSLRATEDMVGQWARNRDPRRPFFLLLHTWEAHDPYGPANHPFPARPWASNPDAIARAAEVHEPWQLARAYFLDGPVRDRLTTCCGPANSKSIVSYINEGFAADPRPDLLAEIHDGYRNGIHWVDSMLDTSVGYLRRSGLLDHSLLVVAGDHGEAFGEHGILGHGRQLYDELVHVPLVMRGPAPFQGGRRISGGMGLVDVLPTFFDFAHLQPPTGIAGRSAMPIVNGESEGWPVIAEETLSSANTGRDEEGLRVSVRTPQFKYVLTLHRSAGTLTEELYDLVADPSEQHDLGDFTKAPTPGLSENFCHAVDAARARIAAVAEADRRRVGTVYGAHLSPVESLPATPCSSQ